MISSTGGDPSSTRYASNGERRRRHPSSIIDAFPLLPVEHLFLHATDLRLDHFDLRADYQAFPLKLMREQHGLRLAPGLVEEGVWAEGCAETIVTNAAPKRNTNHSTRAASAPAVCVSDQRVGGPGGA
jgi:hypothetical protein